MLSQSSTTPWTLLFALALTVVVYRHWRRDRSVGLLLTYVLSFAALHWLAAGIRLLPWFEPRLNDFTLEGLRQSTLAMIGFAIGVEIAHARSAGRRRADDEPEFSPKSARLVTLYLAAGLAVYTLFLMAGRLPIVAAIVSTGSTLVAVGIALKHWVARTQRRPANAWLWIAVTSVFPLVTVVTQGFLGYGFVAMLIVGAFAASLQRARWQAAIAGLLLLYCGLSVYVTYMRDRSDIRDVVWSGERVQARIEQLQNTLVNFEWFDPQQVEHLNRIEKRLNQNHLVGAAVVWIDEGNIDYARGGTLFDAVIAVIPRALWPGKPETAGSGDLVSTYTGIDFAYGTSVGVGQVLELYINFGTVGVVVGFVVLGALIALVDRRSATYLTRGDIRQFMVWYMPGLSLLQIGGSLSEVTATAAASYALVHVVSKFAGGNRLVMTDPAVRPQVVERSAGVAR